MITFALAGFVSLPFQLINRYTGVGIIDICFWTSRVYGAYPELSTTI
ncbi:hypothetical protein HMPREF6745_1419 [Prevotella sp. oral taxon 472 str. F0295]|nr:hypothetical protein HMPREF6745_1419 [Prevotella sp. oral taxon 472 str. F0295]